MKKNLRLFYLIVAVFGIMLKVNAQCTANFTHTVNAGGNVSFQSTSTGTTATTNYNWWYGDSNSGTGNPASHTYSANGVYTVNLFIWDSAPPSCSATAVQTIQVNTATCNIVAGISHTVGTNGSVIFASTSTGTTASTTYTWAFGDNTNGTGITTSHTYSSNGTYMVKLWADNGNNCSDTTIQFVNITNVPCNLQANFTFTNYPNGFVTFMSTSTGTSQSNNTFDWKINHAYHSSGVWTSNTFTNNTYSVTLVVANLSYTPACIDSITQVITVTNNTCNIMANYSFTQIANGVVNFASTSTGTTATTAYFWDFGDGNQFSSTNSSVTHTYTNAGWHQAYLLVFDTSSPGCQDSVYFPININTVPCVANSNFTLTQLSPGNWQATPQYPYNISSATWNWGDNTSSNALYTNHTYSPTGMYTICLTVSVNCGATSTTCASYNITRLSSPMSMAYVNVVPPQTILTSLISNFGKTQTDMIIYPNPSNGEFELMIKDLNQSNAVIEIYSVTGQLINTSSADISNGSLYKQISLKDQANGVYFIKVKTNEGLITKKIILQN